MLEEFMDSYGGCGWWHRGGRKGQDSPWEGKTLEGIREIGEKRWESPICHLSWVIFLKPNWKRDLHSSSSSSTFILSLKDPITSPYPQAAYVQHPDIKGRRKCWAVSAMRRKWAGSSWSARKELWHWAREIGTGQGRWKGPGAGIVFSFTSMQVEMEGSESKIINCCTTSSVRLLLWNGNQSFISGTEQ